MNLPVFHQRFETGCEIVIYPFDTPRRPCLVGSLWKCVHSAKKSRVILLWQIVTKFKGYKTGSSVIVLQIETRWPTEVSLVGIEECTPLILFIDHLGCIYQPKFLE